MRPAQQQPNHQNADLRGVTAIYTRYYQPLVGQAMGLIHDRATAEDIVQDVFAAMHGNWARVRDGDKAPAYLRRCVANRSRSVLRHQAVADRHRPAPAPDPCSAEESALRLIERSSVVSALQRLAPRQRQALALRYYAGMSERQAAVIMGITTGSVKSHTARGRASLREVLLSQTLRFAGRAARHKTSLHGLESNRPIRTSRAANRLIAGSGGGDAVSAVVSGGPMGWLSIRLPAACGLAY